MNVYEIAFITADDKAQEQKIVEDIITQHKGKVTQKNDWGERQFVYRMAHLSKGYYYIWNFTIEPDQLFELKKRLNITEQVVRYLILKVD
ncbi:30S ribosomal protein S6 [Candidatus Roizmanbacteria bacterium RIFCSPLOWO2_01_FULL_42_14]|uniref:Small ribosomal subunit protein bS6 n=3 Tax=Candidatus Roizmaniibacteriota TaxID=1752723 RepID=A0A1F7JTH5_9BACT|nr:MAG: 30S ribosomal protein S6 [Candidatus Roizmanbacteria bacterium RIFCSPHIGHO2_02_FULL_43_11]OGK52055.1 MAG: 30S ribosomal protein S6 [Candidatus Roizmanbacteria bacterium RIFCSPLOWO2_01_FULL_42_14]OGK58901.1 MAG: 30S ribosomal protein S6 [Candidatus Roizmanbacteria bacterium RIFCSPLOWO2_02_FULL_43_10]